MILRWIKLLNSLAIMLPLLATAQDDTASSLEGTSWQLVSIHSVANSKFEPQTPENYLLRFRSGGRLQIEADCNQAGASWQLDGSTLSLTDLVSTRKLCPQPSLFNRYLMNLERVRSITFVNDQLVLQTSSEADRMVFEPYVFVPGG